MSATVKPSRILGALIGAVVLLAPVLTLGSSATAGRSSARAGAARRGTFDPVTGATLARGAAVFPIGIASLDGSAHNQRHPEWGQAGHPYRRVAPARYADRIGAIVPGPDPRRVSNRVFSDLGQNVFSENGVTQWGFAWGQFLAHNFGLRAYGGEAMPLPFDAADPLERFTDDLGTIDFARSLAAPGTR